MQQSHIKKLRNTWIPKIFSVFTKNVPCARQLSHILIPHNLMPNSDLGPETSVAPESVTCLLRTTCLHPLWFDHYGSIWWRSIEYSAYCLEYGLDGRATSISKGLVISPSVRTCSGVRSSSYSVDKANSFSGDRATATRSWPLTSICFWV